MPVPQFLAKFDIANLRLRLISAAIMTPVALLGVYLGGLAYGALITCVVVVGLFEWLRLIVPPSHNKPIKPKMVGIACAMLIFMMLAGMLLSPSFGAMLGVLATLILFLLAAREQNEHAAWVALGIPYMGGSGLALLSLRATPDVGAGLVFFVLLAVWGTDIGAYVAGRIIGGAKLAPAISPSKTWAGLFGGMVLAVVMGYLTARVMGAQMPWVALVLSPLLAVVAQLGDLFESHFKRRSGVKESGDLIPGHGGVLDRIDGLAFAGFFAFLFQKALGEHISWF